MKKIVLASKNSDKVKEMRLVLKDLPLEILSLADFADVPDAVEDGSTFEENALIKAKFFREQTGLACLADDSGLEVDALGGLPGVHSARFAGYHADDLTNNQKLLDELKKIGADESAADYRCALAFVDTDGTVLLSEGKILGKIKTVARGTGGFGYDPYFYLDDEHTMAQLPVDEKNKISHRGAALKEMILKLKEIFS
ncbi:MAG: RdgB/HAM1 family non-canonical purine NTP pyrophosphatase [Selenomonadaceae bacterium]|nr:RdgB/HAM1 family non-canonical purine NTP pyrophosphatase [Selenomonadaceae bacterium]MBQ3726321.1 RdgB/HAM1 family non-canonical purine NTP pyrophosphatase [Selenomonadaceae bacterium]MBQ9497018.1 RdgB/HAM1 family non-canonical purine NTP pyrophosphatase [Selenomonadaceae bacterium]